MLNAVISIARMLGSLFQSEFLDTLTWLVTKIRIPLLSECWFSSQCSVNPRKSEFVLIFDRMLIFVLNFQFHPASKEL